MRPHWFYQENMDSHIISMNQTCTTCPLICWEICGVLQQTLGCFYQMEPNPLNLLGIALICLLIFFPNGARHKRRFDTRHAVTLGREYHKLTVDLMDFMRQPNASRWHHGFVMTDTWQVLPVPILWEHTYRVFDAIDSIDTELGMPQGVWEFHPLDEDDQKVCNLVSHHAAQAPMACCTHHEQRLFS